MNRVIGPDFVALQVRSLEVSQRFYEELLGLEVDPAGPPSAVVFKTEPVPFAVREPVVDLDAVGRLGWGVALWLRCEYSDGLHASLVSAGVEVVREPFDGPFGRTFTFADPDGYGITIHDG